MIEGLIEKAIRKKIEEAAEIELKAAQLRLQEKLPSIVSGVVMTFTQRLSQERMEKDMIIRFSLDPEMIANLEAQGRMLSRLR